MSVPSISSAVLLFCLLSLSAGEVPISGLVNWDQVPSEASAPRNLNNVNLGQCICDLTLNACDPLCCCDAECTAQEKALFKTCSPTVGSTSSVPYCYDSNAATKIVRINSPEPLEESVPGESAVCLIRNNYPSDANTRFTVPENTAVSSPAHSDAAEWFSNNEPNVNFIVGGKVPVMRAVNVSSGWKLVSFGSGFLSIPVPGKRGGFCRDERQRSIKFMDPITLTECFAGTPPESAAVVATLASRCDAMRIADDLYQTIRLPAALNAATIMPIVVNIYDATTGALLETVDPTALINGIVTGINGGGSGGVLERHFQMESVATVTGLTTPTTCTNAVARRSLVIAYDASTSVLRVSNATLSLYVATVDVSAGKQIKTVHSVTFIRTGAAVLPTLHEGHPGFIAGRSVPAGILVSNGTKHAIQQRYGGLSIPSDGNCFSNKRKSVKFLHNVLNAGCSMRISETQLQSLCADATAASSLLLSVLRQNLSDLPYSFPPSLFNASSSFDLIDRVAKTADARYEDPTAWVPIAGLSSFPQVAPLPYDPFRRQCNNLLVGLHYKLVVARAGSVANPQDVIVAAFASPITGTWVVRDDTAYDGTGTTTNYFRFKVSFVRYNQGTSTTEMQAPEIMPRLDDTIFYPFRRA